MILMRSKRNQQSKSACLHAYTHENVTKRCRVFGPLMSVASIAWPSPTGPAHRCPSTPTWSADMRICGLAGKRASSTLVNCSGPMSFQFHLFVHLSEKKNKTFLFSHNLSAMLIIRPPVCFVHTFVLFATIFGRFFALSRCQLAHTCQTI